MFKFYVVKLISYFDCYFNDMKHKIDYFD